MAIDRARQRGSATTPAASPVGDASAGDTTPDVQDAGGNGVAAARTTPPASGAPAPEPASAPAKEDRAADPAPPAPAAAPAADAAPPAKTRDQELAEAVAAGDAARIEALVTAAGEVATVADALAAEHLDALEKLATGGKAALWRRPAIAAALKAGKPVATLTQSAEGKQEALAEALTQGKVVALVEGAAIDGAAWSAALDDASYLKVLEALPHPVTSQLHFDMVWRLYGDGVARSGDCARATFKALYTARILPVGSTEAWNGAWTSTENGEEFKWRWVYQPTAPNDAAMKRFMVGARTLPQGHVNSADIAFSGAKASYWQRTTPNPTTEWAVKAGSTQRVTTSYYLSDSNTIVMNVDATTGAPANDIALQRTADGTGTGAGAPGQRGEMLTYFLNHARHEVGHAVGNRVLQGMTEKGDDFANAWAGWQPESRDAFATAMWSAGGEVELTFPGVAAKSYQADDVRTWLVGLIADQLEPPGNAITRVAGGIAAKLDVIKGSALGAQPLTGYVCAAFEAANKDIRKIQDRGFRQPGFTPPDPVHIYATRQRPAGFWTFSKGAFDQLKSTHGWYSMASYKEMFAEIYTMKYSGGGLPGPVNGKDPAVFFQQLEASTDASLIPESTRGATAPGGSGRSPGPGPGGAMPAPTTAAPAGGASGGSAPTQAPLGSDPAKPLGA